MKDEVPNDETGDLHNSFAHGDEEVEQRFSRFAHFAQSYAQDGGEDHKTEDVGGVLVARCRSPFVQIRCKKLAILSQSRQNYNKNPFLFLKIRFKESRRI